MIAVVMVSGCSFVQEAAKEAAKEAVKTYAEEQRETLKPSLEEMSRKLDEYPGSKELLAKLYAETGGQAALQAARQRAKEEADAGSVVGAAKYEALDLIIWVIGGILGLGGAGGLTYAGLKKRKDSRKRGEIHGRIDDVRERVEELKLEVAKKAEDT